jgi:aminoglycoside phosphotransferase (APT) family kinase protein
LTSLEATVRATDDPDVLADVDREWLLGEITDIRAQLGDLDWPLGYGLIHGDAWAGNLLWDTTHAPAGAQAARPLLGDWDGLAHGPREIDLIPTWHAATRYGRGPAWADAFTTSYGHDLATWTGYPLLARMRDLVQLTGPLRRTRRGNIFERVLRQRLGGIRTRDTSVWAAL